MCVFIPDGANPIANGTRWYKDETITTPYVFDTSNPVAGYGISGSSGPYEKYYTYVGNVVNSVNGLPVKDFTKVVAGGGFTCPYNP
jgi:hypothetical protein